MNFPTRTLICGERQTVAAVLLVGIGCGTVVEA